MTTGQHVETMAAGERESLVEALRSRIVPFTDAEFEEAMVPPPHAFQSGETGAFPIGEVTVLASQSREGKTGAIVGIATAIVTEHPLAGLSPKAGRSVVIMSAEDDRKQFARKVGAQRAVLPPAQAHAVKRIIVPDIDDFARMERVVVGLFEGQPMETSLVEAIIQAVEPLMQGPHPLAAMVFETASTLSEANEDNPGYRALIMALRRVARTLQIAVVLTHHVSQASLANLSEMNLSTADFRGGTALVNNARQVAMLVNLGCDADSHPDGDARTVLRKMVSPNDPSRITALITLDSSKSIPPAPIFFRWVTTKSGPACVEHEPPIHLQGRSWRKLREMVMAERADRRTEAKVGARNTNVELVIRTVSRMEQSGRQPTARAVSIEAGKSPTWATPYLDAACETGHLTCHMEQVPRTAGKTKVYRAGNDSTDGVA